NPPPWAMVYSPVTPWNRRVTVPDFLAARRTRVPRRRLRPWRRRWFFGDCVVDDGSGRGMIGRRSGDDEWSSWCGRRNNPWTVPRADPDCRGHGVLERYVWSPTAWVC